MVNAKLIRGIFGAFALGASSFFGTLFLLVPAVPFAFIPNCHTAFRYYTDFFVSVWLTFAIAVMRMLHGVHIVTHGDRIAHPDRALIVMNHRTRLDWFYFWSTAVTDGFIFNLKIALKRTLARIPGAGWAQQLGGFLFLNRRAEVDLPRISAYLKYLSRFEDRAFKLLVFPEGTDFCPISKQRSDSYADKNGLPKYNYVLHPRTTGVDYAFDTLSSLKALDAIYDVTIAYKGPFPSSELAVISGDLPQNVHFFVKRYPAEEVAKYGPTKFWQKLWSDKEQFLKKFYEGETLEEMTSPGRCEGSLETFYEWAAIVFWTLFLSYIVFIVIPVYWVGVLFVTACLIGWSELIPDSIDGTIVNAGNK